MLFLQKWFKFLKKVSLEDRPVIQSKLLQMFSPFTLYSLNTICSWNALKSIQSCEAPARFALNQFIYLLTDRRNLLKLAYTSFIFKGNWRAPSDKRKRGGCDYWPQKEMWLAGPGACQICSYDQWLYCVSFQLNTLGFICCVNLKTCSVN